MKNELRIATNGTNPYQTTTIIESNSGHFIVQDLILGKLKEKNVKLHSYKFYMTELYLRHEIWVISGGIFHAFVELKSSITICGTRTLYTAF